MNTLPKPLHRRWIYLLAVPILLAAPSVMRAATFPLLPPQQAQEPRGLKNLTDGKSRDGRPRLSPDGKFVAFHSNRGANTQIFVLSLEDGSIKAVTPLDYGASNVAWAPDGKSIAFLANGGDGQSIWILPLTGGNPSRVTEGSLGAAHPDFSPDGSRMTFISGAAGSVDIYTVSISEGTVKRLTTHPDQEYQPRWSPDGKWIAFYTTWDRKMTDIWMVPSEGGEPVQITSHLGEDYGLAWSPDSRWILFTSTRAFKTDLWAVPVSGGDPVKITNGTLDAGWPHMSLAGKKVVFLNHSASQLMTIPAAGGEPVRVRDGSRTVENPAYSPDGRFISYVADGHITGFKMRFMTAEGTEPRGFVDPNDRPDSPVLHKAPAWSPDGRRMAFVLNHGGGPHTHELWAMSPEGADATLLSDMGIIRFPVWCDEGKTVFFRGQGKLWKVPGDGSSAPAEASDIDGNVVPNGCSADGRKLLVQKRSEEMNGLFLVPVEGGPLQALETGTDSAERGRFSRDGSRLAFISRVDGRPEIFVLRLEDGHLTRLTHDGKSKSAPKWSADGERLVYALSPGNPRIAIIEWDFAAASDGPDEAKE